MIILIQRQSQHLVSTIHIDRSGITIDGLLRYWSQVKTFWIEYNPGGLKEISLEFKRWWMPYLKIPLKEQDPIALRDFLIQFLPEQEHSTSLIDTILKEK